MPGVLRPRIKLIPEIKRVMHVNLSDQEIDRPVLWFRELRLPTHRTSVPQDSDWLVPKLCALPDDQLSWSDRLMRSRQKNLPESVIRLVGADGAFWSLGGTHRSLL
jgi:hypothetical protein